MMRIDTRYRAVGFDMDGTLLDTRVDYRRMTEIVLDEMKRMGVPESAIDRSGDISSQTQGWNGSGPRPGRTY